MIQEIHQIELTSRCNLRCSYCINSKMERPRQDMSEETLESALRWLRFFVKQGTQNDVNLAGTGESMMHPRFIEFVSRVRDAAPGSRLLLATNGTWVTEDRAKQLAALRVGVWVSLHEPALAAEAVRLLKRYGALEGVSMDPAVNPNDWAGQVKWHKADYRIPCTWQRRGMAFVASDGRLLTCCLDGRGASSLGRVCEEPRVLETKPWALCASCYQQI